MGGQALLLFFMVVAPGSPEAPHSLAGPYREGALGVYVVRGEETDARSYISLDEALASGKVSLRERGNGSQADVNILEVQNDSDQWVFLHVGDILRGGKQDRTLGADMILPPRAPFQPIDAFCVEPGRWSSVGGVSGGVAAFDANTAVASGRDLKLSIQKDRDQHQVWAAVAEQRAAAAGFSSMALASTGTYNAIVENETMRGRRDRYVKTLLPEIEAVEDALGIVVSIGGDIVGADIYASHALFLKLAPKLLDSYAQEAILETGGETAPPPTKESVAAFLAKRKAAPTVDESLSGTMTRQTRESEDAVVFDYRFKDEGPAVHSSYIKKK